MSGPITFGLPRINYPINITVDSLNLTTSPVLVGRYSAGGGNAQEIALSAPFSVTGGTLSLQAAAQFNILGRKTAGAGAYEDCTRAELSLARTDAANLFPLPQQINQNAIPPAIPGVALLYLVNADGSSRAGVFQDMFANNCGNYFRRANGTSAAPTALILNSAIMNILCAGYGATAYGANRVVQSCAAAEAWTDAAQGTYMSWNLTTPGSLTQLTGVLRIDADRGLQLMGGGTTNVVIDTNRGLRRRAFTFATLPAAATSQDVEFVITDGAAAPVWLAAAAGGGAVRTPVISNGIAWLNG